MKNLKNYNQFINESGPYSKLEDEFEESVINVLRKSLDFYDEFSGKMEVTFKDGSTAIIDPIAFTKVSTNDEKPSDADYFVRTYREGIQYDKLVDFVKRNSVGVSKKGEIR